MTAATAENPPSLSDLTPDQVRYALRNVHKLPPDRQTKVLEVLRELTARRKARRARESLLEFVKRVDKNYKIGAHHRKLAGILEDMAYGRKLRATISMPPRFGKSLLTSTYFPAWYIGNFPDHQIMMVSHTADLAVDFGRKVRNLISTEEYKAIFPDVALAPDSKSAGRWNTNKGGSYYAAGVGGAIAGRGANFLCVCPRAVVHTLERGAVPAGTVKAGEHIWAFRGFELVQKQFDSVSSESVLVDGVRMTPNHPVWTFNRGWVECESLTTHELLHTITLWSYVRLYAEIWYGLADNARRKLLTGLQHLVADAPTLQQPECGELSLVRRTWDHLLRALGEVRCVLGGYGVSAEPEGQAGQDRLRQGVLQGELPLGGRYSAGAQPQEQREHHGVWENTVRLRVGGRTGVDTGSDQPSGFQARNGAGRSVYYQTDELGAAPRATHEFGWLQRTGVRLIGLCREAFSGKTGIALGCAEALFASKVFGLLVGVRRVSAVEHECGSSTEFVNFQVAESNTFFVGALMTHNCIDDAVNEQDVLTGNYEVFEKAYDWYTYGARTRLMPSGKVAIIGTRWSQDDLIGRVVRDMARNPDGDQWEVVELPAIMDIDTPEARSLWPEQWSLEELLKTRAVMPPFQWNAQYMQQPTSAEASIIKRDWWQPWERDDPPQCEYIIMSLDAAAEKNNRADYTSLTTWGVFYRDNEHGEEEAAVILLNAIKERMEFPELKARAYEEYQQWQPDWMVVEKKSSGTPLYQEMRAAGIPVQEYTPHRGTGDKTARLNSIADIFASGMVWYPAGRRWAEEVVDEVCGFPAMPHDDHCLTGDILILMADGTEKPIVDVVVGDYVQTPEGPKQVLASHCTGVRDVFTMEVGGRTLCLTDNHPVATLNGWKTIRQLNRSDAIVHVSTSGGVVTWCSNVTRAFASKLLCSTVGGTAVTPTPHSPHTDGISEGPAGFSTAMCGSSITGQYLKVTKSTTSTRTRPTTTSAILNVCPRRSIGAWSTQVKLRMLSLMNSASTSLGSGSKPLSGTDLMRAGLGIGSTPKTASPKLIGRLGTMLNRSLKKLASSAAQSSWARSPRTSCVQTPASALDATEKCAKQNSASHTSASAVAPCSTLSKQGLSFAACSVATSTIVSAGKESVYNLSVEGAECYFANGVLVHNCDTTIMALMRFRNGGFIRLPSDRYDDEPFTPKRAAYY